MAAAKSYVPAHALPEGATYNVLLMAAMPKDKTKPIKIKVTRMVEVDEAAEEAARKERAAKKAKREAEAAAAAAEAEAAEEEEEKEEKEEEKEGGGD